MANITFPAGWREITSETETGTPVFIGGGMSEKIEHILAYEGKKSERLDGLWDILKKYKETEGEDYIPYFCYRGEKDVVYDALDPDRLRKVIGRRFARRGYEEEDISKAMWKIYALFCQIQENEANPSESGYADFDDCIEVALEDYPAIGSFQGENVINEQRFDPRQFSLPFYPGDPIYWVDKDLMKIRVQKRGITAVAITSDGILIQQPDSAELVVPDSDDFCCVTLAAAKERLAQMKQVFPIRTNGETLSGWLDPAKYLPEEGQRVLVTNKTGGVQECSFFTDWPTCNDPEQHDVFVSYHRKAKIVDIVSWKPLPDPDFRWRDI